MSLPTFSELMASLNLSSTGEPEAGAEASPYTEPGPSSSSSSPSPSRSLSPTASSQHLPSTSDSPSIVVSEPHSPHSPRSPRSGTTRSLGRANRFSPYLGAAANVHIRRSSLPEEMLEASKQEVPDRSSSVSPRMHNNTLRDVSMNATQPVRPRRRSKVMHIDVDAAPDVPISSFARRHTPQSSPTAPTFHHRKRSGSFSPVLLPTLLPGLSSPHYATEAHHIPSEQAEVSHPDSPFQRNRRPQGLKISSYRVVSQPHENRTITVHSVL